VVLFEGHVWRLGEAARAPLQQFAAQAGEGVYRVWWAGGQLTTERRGPSVLVEGMPVRQVVSPFIGVKGRYANQASPSAYDAVHVPGVATLLTDARGEELYEADTAALVAWDGASLVLAPEDVPGVASVAEWVVAKLPHRRARLLVSSGWPLLLINALVGTCAPAGCGEFPREVRTRLPLPAKRGEGRGEGP
jgi:hypothetical protein